jgi:hypothetical protein
VSPRALEKLYQDG